MPPDTAAGSTAAYDVVVRQRDELRRRLEGQGRWGARQAAAGLAVLGAAILGFWYLTNDRSAASMLLLLAAIAVLAIAVLLYFLSPARFLRSDVADALAVTGVLNAGRILSSLLIEGRGIYLPSAEAGTPKVFVPVANGAPGEIPVTGNIFVSRGSKGVLLDPPGYGLLAYVKQISPQLAEDDLGAEIADLLKNGLELARQVAVRRDGDLITVAMDDLATAGLCATVRRESPKLCAQIGCPLCSFVACAIADATRRRVRIEDVEAGGGTVRTTFRLL